LSLKENEFLLTRLEQDL